MQKFMPIPGATEDSRAVRTRDALASALIALMHEKGFDDISVQEICERAQVGRSTFYAHFQDRDELFIRHTVVFGRTLGEQLTWDEALGSYCFPVRWLFAHLRQMKPVFDSLTRARKTAFIMKVWQNNIAEVFVQRVAAVRGAGSTAATTLPAAVLAEQLAGTLVTLMVWWMDHHYPLAEHEMERHFQHLIAGIGR